MAVSCYNFPVIYLVLCLKPQNMFFFIVLDTICIDSISIVGIV